MRVLYHWTHRWIHFFLLCCLTDAGRYVSVNTTSDHAHYFLNDLGVNVKAGFLIFDLTSTQDAIIQLAQKQTRTENTCDVIFGSSSNAAIVVRESCSGCNSIIMASGTFLDTIVPAHFWMDWSDGTDLKVGQGNTLGESLLFTYTWSAQFEINYATATSYYSNSGQWNFLIDTPPVFTSPEPGGSTVVVMAENSPINSVVITLSANDAEADTVTFYVVGQHSANFEIQGNDVLLKEELDYETEKWFLVTIIGSDGRHNVTVTFTLHVSDVIDEAPVLTLGPVTSVAEELSVGTSVIGLFAAEDSDEGDVMTFSLEGSHSTYFTINDTSGQISVAQRLDREGGLSRLDDLRVKVMDKAGQSSTLSLDLEVDDINDNKPQFDSSDYLVNVTSSTRSDVPLMTFGVSDADLDNNSDVSLTLVTPQPGFWISGTDLYVNVSQLELSTQSGVTLVVEASDGASEKERLTSVVVVQVVLGNDHAPVWAQPVPDSAGWLPELSVSENVTVASRLFCLSANDADLGQAGDVTYLMTSAMTEDGQNSSDKFFLEPTSGCLTTASVLDRDIVTGGTAFYILTFQAHDTGSRSSEAKVKVNLTDVNDNAPIFSQTVYSVRLQCNAEIGSTAATISANDEDIISTLFFAFTNGDSEYFELDSVTGDVILVKNITSVADECRSQVLDVSVTDGGVPELTSTAVVVVQIDGCSATSSSDSTDDSKLRLTNQLLMAGCGVLGTALLLSTILLCIAKASQTTPVKPVAISSNTAPERWSTRRSLDSIPSNRSSASGNDSVVTDLTDSASCLSLYNIGQEASDQTDYTFSSRVHSGRCLRLGNKRGLEDFNLDCHIPVE